MKRLILTTSDSGAGALKAARVADAVLGFGYRFVWGPLLSEVEIANSLRPLGADRAVGSIVFIMAGFIRPSTSRF
jgi:hypothetical protein